MNAAAAGPSIAPEEIVSAFDIPGSCVSIVPFGKGHINDTYLSSWRSAAPGGADARGGDRCYIHQRINDKVFRRPDQVMENIARVTAHLARALRREGADDIERRTLAVVPARSGESWHRDRRGGWWRTYLFIGGTRAEDRVESSGQARLLGAAIGQVVTPMLTETMPISQAQLYYGVAAAAAALLFVLFAREKPVTPPDASAEGERALMLAGLKRALSLKSFRRYLLMAFIGLGIFNGVTTWIEGIVRPRGFDSMQAGVAVAAMLVAGIVGAVAIPALSDRRGRRKPYIILGLLGGIPGIVGLALAPSYPLLIASSAVLGFFLVSVNPIGTQYASETALPTPEGTSNGLISLAGQLSVILVYAMEPLKRVTGSYVAPLLCFAAMLGASAALAATLVETPSGNR